MIRMGYLTVVMGAALLVAACATTTNEPVKTAAAGANGSGFLGKDYALLTPGETSKGQAGLRYYNPATRWAQYSKVMVDPVTFWGDEAGKVPAADQQALSAYFNTALEKAFKEKFEVVTAPAPGVAKLQLAVVDVEAATPGLRTISMVAPQARLLSTVGSAASGKQVFAGSLQVETRLVDASTGQLLAAAVARSVGGTSMKTAAQWQWGDAENAMNDFSARAAANLHALTSGSATPAQLPVK